MENNNTNNIPQKTNSFTKGMIKDTNDSYIGEGIWTHARNLVNNSHDGNVGVIGNEPSNLHCIDLPYTLIGCISTDDDEWILFTTNNTDSEIGLFKELNCTYTKLVNSPCLNFNTKNLITGIFRKTFDCSKKVYWSDGRRNPDRVLDINNIPWVQNCTTTNNCVTCVPTNQLDCEKLRIAPLLSVPCLSLTKGNTGTLMNGTYQVAVAYMVNEIKITDYLQISNAVSIWDHSGTAGGLNLELSNLDGDYSEIEVVVIANTNGQVYAKRLGIYSTRQSLIYIDSLNNALISIPIEYIPLQTPVIESSDKISAVNNYALRIGPSTKPEINYQPIANYIRAKWVNVKYPGNYYNKGGANVGYMRDEVYSFFIRWVYNTGDKSASYHIPCISSFTNAVNLNQTLPDGGIITKEGYTLSYTSTEKYPDDKPLIWNSSLVSNSLYNLCGQNIVHHRFPSNDVLPHFNSDDTINVLGIKFENINPPRKDPHNPLSPLIPGIVGYEILRGSREGNKSIIAKGMVNNMKSYNNDNSLFQNYPYNDSDSNDPFYNISFSLKQDYLSFHSPDTTFNQPFLGKCDLKVYLDIMGEANGNFKEVYKHPQFRLLNNFANNLINILNLLNYASTFSGTPVFSTTLAASSDLPFSSTIAPLPPLLLNNSSPADPSITLQNIATTALWIAQAVAITAYNTAMLPVIKQKLLEIFKNLAPFRQYAVQMDSIGNYNTYKASTQQLSVNNYSYIKDGVYSFNGKLVNNLYRNKYVLLKTDSNLSTSPEKSILLGETGNTYYSNLVSKYAAIKLNLTSQYGQIDSIRQIPITSCVQETNNTTSDLLFSGDTYINRYTEKNNFTFFNDWLFQQPNDYQYDYRKYQNIPNVRYYVNNERMIVGFGNIFENVNSYRNLYNETSGSSIGFNNINFSIHVEKGSFFVSYNGIRNFYVESEVNVGYRDWVEDANNQSYIPYTSDNASLDLMFRSDNIKYPEVFKYDYSLSASKLYNQYVNWGYVLPRSFDPSKAETCYSYYPRRINYSLPQAQELKKDNWVVYLANNYKDFPAIVNTVKQINKTGAIILMENKSPLSMVGVDTMETDAGTKVTIGDGGLFNQPLQSQVNSDEIFEYGSCQNARSVVSTPQGVFYVSQDQGKVFLWGGSLNEISNSGMKWWFSRYLPSNLKKYFPNFTEHDNTVEGAGVITTYDNTNEIVYITKKDYIPLREDIQYISGVGFVIPTNITSNINKQSLLNTACPEDYVPVYNVINTICECVKYQNSQVNLATFNNTLRNVASNSTTNSWTKFGTLVYDNNFNDNLSTTPLLNGFGTFTNIGKINRFWINENANEPYNVVKKLMREHTDIKNPIYNVFLNLENEVTYYVALCSGTEISNENGIDNRIILLVDNKEIINLGISDFNTKMNLLFPTSIYSGFDARKFYNSFLHIFPITLSAGKHTITFKALAQSGIMVLNNTLNDLINATSLDDLNPIFTTYRSDNSNIDYTSYDYDATSAPNKTFVPGETYVNSSTILNTISLTPVEVTQPPIQQVNYIPIKTCDTTYFKDVSWTISYDLKNKQWLSFHDWHPTFMLPSKTHFLTSYNECGKNSSLWKHNNRWDSYCNFYNKNYPFEIEYVVSTGSEITTIKNIEYYLEAYKYNNNGQDKFHVLDYNFDSAIVYNSEQISGLLNLNIKSKNNPFVYLNYPIINPTGSTEILFSKEEQKYRLNQFYDITKDRGEFTNVKNNLIVTLDNGYVWYINPSAVDYYKSAIQHKKFRHNINKVLLRKNTPPPVESIPASPPTNYNLVPVKYISWGKFGAALAPSISYNGIINNINILSTNYWKQKINDIAVWSNSSPINTWIGFEECFTVDADKTYYIGVAADNLYRLKLDNNIILSLESTTPNSITGIIDPYEVIKNYTLQPSFSSLNPLCPTCPANSIFESSIAGPYQLFLIVPVTLTAGVHKISLEAMDLGNPGMFAAEIYDNTNSEIISATSDNSLNILFSTKGKTSFYKYDYQCPKGYNLIPQENPCNTPQCEKITEHDIKMLFKFINTKLQISNK